MRTSIRASTGSSHPISIEAAETILYTLSSTGHLRLNSIFQLAVSNFLQGHSNGRKLNPVRAHASHKPAPVLVSPPSKTQMYTMAAPSKAKPTQNEKTTRTHAHSTHACILIAAHEPTSQRTRQHPLSTQEHTRHRKHTTNEQMSHAPSLTPSPKLNLIIHWSSPPAG